MECQDVRQLLVFVNRPNEELDVPEQEAVKQHIENCQDCGELARSERRADEAFGAVMRDVPVPAHLKQRIMKRLAANRGARPWKWIAAAAAILIAVSSGLFWNQQSRPEVRLSDLPDVVSRAMDELQAEQYFASEGLHVSVPRYLKYGDLQKVEVVEFKGRRVAQLVFSRIEENPPVIASVLILPAKQFRMNMKDLADQVIRENSTLIQIRSEERNNEYFTDLIYYRGNLESLRRDFN